MLKANEASSQINAKIEQVIRAVPGSEAKLRSLRDSIRESSSSLAATAFEAYLDKVLEQDTESAKKAVDGLERGLSPYIAPRQNSSTVMPASRKRLVSAVARAGVILWGLAILFRLSFVVVDGVKATAVVTRRHSSRYGAAVNYRYVANGQKLDGTYRYRAPLGMIATVPSPGDQILVTYAEKCPTISLPDDVTLNEMLWSAALLGIPIISLLRSRGRAIKGRGLSDASREL